VQFYTYVTTYICVAARLVQDTASDCLLCNVLNLSVANSHGRIWKQIRVSIIVRWITRARLPPTIFFVIWPWQGIFPEDVNNLFLQCKHVFTCVSAIRTEAKPLVPDKMGRTLVKRNLVESPFLRKPDFSRMYIPTNPDFGRKDLGRTEFGRTRLW
jgi:hypothetical protein